MVRRVGGLWERVTALENLLSAAVRAARGKRARHSVARFLERSEWESLRLHEELVAETYRPGRAVEFEIREPKLRRITVFPFRDRVVHHALLAVIEPVLSRSLIHETFACRPGKGTHRALDHAQRLLRRHAHTLKLDIAAFFASIAHAQVMARLERRIKDRAVLRLCARILAGGGDGAPDARGLPIGSLTSQWFANLQLDPLDHFVKETLGIPGYVRYMDDFVLFADDRETLRRAHEKVETFVRERLDLSLKPGATRLARAEHGLPFLGWRLYRGHRRLRPENLRRSRRTVERRWREFARGRIAEDALVASIASICEHLRHGSTRALRRSWFALERGGRRERRVRVRVQSSSKEGSGSTPARTA